MRNYINYVGVDTNLPSNIKYFKEDLFDITICKKNQSKHIKSIISTMVDWDIISTKLVNTEIRVSNEGQRLSGKKLLIEVSLSYKIKYLSDSIEKNLYIIKSKNTKIMYIVLPGELNNDSIDSLIRKKKFQIDIFVEDIYAELRGEDNIYIRTLILANLKFLDKR